MSVAKKSFIQRQHFLLAEKRRKEARKHGNKNVCMAKWRETLFDK